MVRYRISIGASLCVILCSALILAAIKSGSNDWFKVIYSLTFVVLIYAGIAARYRGPFWHGFAVVGWAYFLVGFGAWMDGGGSASRWQRVTNRDLVSSVVIELASSAASPPAAPRGAFVDTMSLDNATANRDGIVHSALTMLFATLGGLFSRRMAGRPHLGASPVGSANADCLSEGPQ